jgi:hypothetical protein
MRLVTITALAAVVLLGSGCATLTKGTSQTVTVNTDPPGAVCTLTRDAKPLAVVNPTPGSISIAKSSGAIAVICKKDKFQDAAGTLSSEFQAMTFGNILFGGLIGVVVDAASGATHEYPPLVTITLIPTEFATIADRDSFYERMRQNLLREAAEVKERIANECRTRVKATSPGTVGATSSTLPPQCDKELAAADAGTQAKLAEIEQRRLLAKVAAPQ